MVRVLGLDLSLTCTGIAAPADEYSVRIKPRIIKEMTLEQRFDRIAQLRSRLVHELAQVLPTHVVVEGPSHGSTGGHEHERGGWWWSALGVVHECDIDILVATPTMIKKFATGSGNADKDLVLSSAVRAFPWFQGGNDEADALWAAAMGHQHLGQPLLERTAKQLEALKTWS